ncbi:MAG: hypothetical protein ACRERD_15740, partial [Candidatus Binatia bacterium]
AQQFSQLGQAAERHTEAEKEQQRQHALEAQQQVEQSHLAAEQAKAPQYAQKLYQKGLEVKQQGKQELEAQKWTEATGAFVQANELFAEALRSAQRIRAKQGAEIAREKALAAQREAQAGNGADLFPARFTEAGSLLRQAEQAFVHEGFGTAQSEFERSAALFWQVYQDALKENAAQAGARARELQTKVGAIKDRQKKQQKKQADRALIAGDHLLQKEKKYAEALASYKEAASLFAALQAREPALKEPVVLDRPIPTSHVPTITRNPAFLLSGSVLLTLAVAGLYLVGPFRLSSLAPSGDLILARPAPPAAPSPAQETQSVKVVTRPVGAEAQPSVIPLPEESSRLPKKPAASIESKLPVTPPSVETAPASPPPIPEVGQIAKTSPPPQPELVAPRPPLITQLTP